MSEADRWGLYPGDWERIEEIRQAPPYDRNFVGRLMIAAYKMRQELEADEKRLEECKSGK